MAVYIGAHKDPAHCAALIDLGTWRRDPGSVRY
jgi:hypothetical protein